MLCLEDISNLSICAFFGARAFSNQCIKGMKQLYELKPLIKAKPLPHQSVGKECLSSEKSFLSRKILVSFTLYYKIELLLTRTFPAYLQFCKKKIAIFLTYMICKKLIISMLYVLTFFSDKS